MQYNFKNMQFILDCVKNNQFFNNQKFFFELLNILLDYFLYIRYLKFLKIFENS